MATPRIYITRPLPAEAMTRLEGVAEYRMWDRESEPVPRDTLLREIVDVDGIVCLITEKMDAEVIERARRCRVIAQVAVGHDNIDVAAATKRGILVTNTPGVLTETSADMAWAILLATARRVVEGDKFTRSGRWKTWELMGFTGQDVHGATLGIVGMGRIGAAIARRSRGFGMPLLYHNRRRNEALEQELGATYAPLDDLLRQSDFVMLSTALTPETRHLIGERELGLMKPTATIVNISRGPVLDQRALYRALVDKKIWAAGLDVFEVEPVPMDDPLLRLDNVVIPPHLGSASIATRIKMATMAVDNCLASVTGKIPPNLVNPEALERR
ncbi:MAG TPA: D-glycerate dehydrogenase [bacterium]|nr:D-glycerate dehydrogenase [bacterium]